MLAILIKEVSSDESIHFFISFVVHLSTPMAIAHEPIRN